MSQEDLKPDFDTIIVGGGAAGFFTAINLKNRNPKLKLSILEATKRPLAKVKISGGGRCNVTHSCFTPRELVSNYPRGYRELISVFHRFQPQDTIEWFKSQGIQLKTEKDGRMFPSSNKSQSIIDCFQRLRRELEIPLVEGSRVKDIAHEKEIFTLSLGNEKSITSRTIVMATGSDPRGIDLLSKLGQPLVDPVPSLFTFKVNIDKLPELAGQSVQNAHVNLSIGKKKLSQQGPVLFTHWGLSGPAILKLSAFGARELKASEYQAELSIDWLPHLSQEQLKTQLKRAKDNLSNKNIMGTPPADLNITKRLWRFFCHQAGVPETRTWSEISKAHGGQLLILLKAYQCKVHGKGVFKDEFVTAGGVDLKSVDFKSLMSKKVKGLYFAGEVLNIDGITGGFNFQNAWSTGWIAAQNISESLSAQ